MKVRRFAHAHTHTHIYIVIITSREINNYSMSNYYERESIQFKHKRENKIFYSIKRVKDTDLHHG